MNYNRISIDANLGRERQRQSSRGLGHCITLWLVTDLSLISFVFLLPFLRSVIILSFININFFSFVFSSIRLCLSSSFYYLVFFLPFIYSVILSFTNIHFLSLVCSFFHLRLPSSPSTCYFALFIPLIHSLPFPSSLFSIFYSRLVFSFLHLPLPSFSFLLITSPLLSVIVSINIFFSCFLLPSSACFFLPSPTYYLAFSVPLIHFQPFGSSLLPNATFITVASSFPLYFTRSL